MACLFFFFAGWRLIPHVGIENDEALFAQGIYQPRGDFSIALGPFRIPGMLMSYVGALKSWVYWPILHLFGPRLSTLREPVLLAGVASLGLFFLLLRRIAGQRAAVIGCSLLATDSIYLLTICFDWGPVALQHLLTVAGMLLLVKFYQERGQFALAGGFFLFGLALWDKAVATWMLGGLAAAAILIFPRQILGLINVRRIAVATLAFALGALPLIVYNAESSFGTFRGSLRRDTSNLVGKAYVVGGTANGAALFGWLNAEDSQTPAPHHPQGVLQKASAGLSEFAGHPRRSLLLYAFGLALLLAPLAGRDGLRIMLFSSIAMAVAWIQMATTAGAGATAHHTILLWPLPEMMIAVAFAAASRRLGRAGAAAVGATVAVIVLSGALVINEYYALVARNGGGKAWNDATFQLSGYLKSVPAKSVVCLDWGILDPLRLLNAGKFPLAGSDPISKPDMSPDERKTVQALISDPANIFIAHTKEFEVFPGARPRLIQLAADSGYQRELMAVIQDGYGRRVFEVYRFVKGGR